MKNIFAATGMVFQGLAMILSLIAGGVILVIASVFGRMQDR